MRFREALAVVILLVAGAGKLHAQTPDIQRMVDTRIAVLRLEGGTAIAVSLWTLARVGLEEQAESLRLVGEGFWRVYDRLAMRAAGKP